MAPGSEHLPQNKTLSSSQLLKEKKNGNRLHKFFMEETWRNGEAGTLFHPLCLLVSTTIAKLSNYKHKKLTKLVPTVEDT